MLDMIRAAGVAALLATAPALASAATLNPANNIVDGGTYDIFADSYFYGAQFALNEAASTITFTFTNNSSTAAALVLTGVSVLQATAQFTGGVAFDFDHTPGAELVVGPGQTTATNFQTTLAANSMTTFTVNYGTVKDTGPKGGSTGIQFAIEASAVPVPAAGLMLLGGLGGLAALRRRRKAA